MAGRGHRDIFAHDIEWNPGQDPGVSYARFLFEEGNPEGPLVILSKFEPGSRVPPHTHGTNYFEYIVEGGQTVGKTWFGPGDVRFANAGTGYGPIVVGPDGCSVVIVFQKATGANTIPLGKEAVEGGV